MVDHQWTTEELRQIKISFQPLVILRAVREREREGDGVKP